MIMSWGTSLAGTCLFEFYSLEFYILTNILFEAGYQVSSMLVNTVLLTKIGLLKQLKRTNLDQNTMSLEIPLFCSALTIQILYVIEVVLISYQMVYFLISYQSGLLYIIHLILYIMIIKYITTLYLNLLGLLQ